MISKEYLDLIVCPLCRKKLEYDKENQYLICRECGLKYPVTDGIPELLEERAEPIKG